MPLCITYTGENAAILGYLLHKDPDRPQKFALGYGEACVFYPEATEESALRHCCWVLTCWTWRVPARAACLIVSTTAPVSAHRF